MAHLALDKLGHQAIDRATTSGNLLQDGSAILFFFQSPFEGLNLSPNPADAPEKAFFISLRVCQFDFLPSRP